jgi:hypothetical protein
MTPAARRVLLLRFPPVLLRAPCGFSARRDAPWYGKAGENSTIISQETLAFESGYHPTYIGQLERGKKSPSLRAILSLDLRGVAA